MQFVSCLFYGLIVFIGTGLNAQNIYIYPEQALEFGDFTVLNGGGTVTISSNGDRTSSGTTQLLNSNYHPAIFSISTDSPQAINVLVEVTREELTNTDGTSISLTSVSPTSEVYVLQPGKPLKMVIGGTIQMNSEKFSSGAFYGNISITVTRNE